MSAENRIIAYGLILVLMPIFCAFLVFLVGSFTAANTDPTQWTQASRLSAALLWAVISFASTGTALAIAGHEFDQIEKLRNGK